MHTHVIRTSPMSLRHITNGVVSRYPFGHRQTIRGLTESSYHRRLGRLGQIAYLRKDFSLSRIVSNCVVVACSLAIENVEPSAQKTEIEISTTTPKPKRSELSNGPLPDTIELGELLGKGTFGEVYHGIEKNTGEKLAVKIISKKRSGSDEASMNLVMQRVEHEVSMWCELQNFSSAVRLEKFYEDDDHVYLVQELCSGGSLQDFMAIRGFLSEVETAHVMVTVLSMLQYCHKRNICYCDIKPANFILPTSSPNLSAFYDLKSKTSTDFVKVIDFGSCEHLPKNGLRGQKGTPLYTAPEVQHSRYGTESDVWSAGVMMYYLLSGEIPFIGKPDKQLNPSALSFYIAHGELKFDGPAWSQVSQEAKDLISQMLERSVKKRITASEALDHTWIKQRAALSMISTAFSDICPMETPAAMTLKEV